LRRYALIATDFAVQPNVARCTGSRAALFDHLVSKSYHRAEDRTLQFSARADSARDPQFTLRNTVKADGLIALLRARRMG
jgi:hypothetical protein